MPSTPPRGHRQSAGRRNASPSWATTSPGATGPASCSRGARGTWRRPARSPASVTSRPWCWRGETSFGALGALLERCRFVVGTDNGALHLATARGVPTVRLFGPVDPAAWGAGLAPLGPHTPLRPRVSRGTTSPWPPNAEPGRHAALRPLPSPRPASLGGRLGTGEGAYPCMRDLTAEAVIAAAERVWALTEGMAAARGR